MPGPTRRILVAVSLAAMLGLTAPALSDDGHPYFGPETVDLTALLVPPPAQDSAVTKAELAEVKALQASVGEERRARAIADNGEGYRAFVAPTSLAGVETARIPLTIALIQRVVETENVVTRPAKLFFARPRPPKGDAAITPLVALSKSGAYPSGRATNGTATAIVLSMMVPEKRGEFMARAEDYATSGLILGVHYRSDLGAGFASGAVIARQLQENAAFQKDLAAAKAELRGALGLQ